MTTRDKITYYHDGNLLDGGGDRLREVIFVARE
jgi:hypothetical protein